MPRRWEKLLSGQVGRTADLHERDPSCTGPSISGQVVDMLDERRLKLTADHAVGRAVEKVVLVKRSIKAEVADVALRVQSPDQRTGFDAESDRRVHRDRDSHEVGSADLGLVQKLDGEIQAFHLVAAPGQYVRGSGGYSERLVAELIAGDEEYVHTELGRDRVRATGRA